MKLMNQDLLHKWLWRIGEDPDFMWGKVLVAVYGVEWRGWDIQGLQVYGLTRK